MASTLVKGGSVVDCQAWSTTSADVLVDGNRIVAVAPDVDPPPGTDVIDADGGLVLPGFVNAHTHAHNALSRGSAGSWTLEDLLLRAPALQGGRTYEDHYLSAATNAVEMLQSGCTSAIDSFAIYPEPDAELVGAVVQAYADVGLRAVLAPALADVPFHATVPGLTERLPAEVLDTLAAVTPPTADALLGVAETVHDRWDGAAAGRIEIGLAPAIPTQCSDELLDGCAQLSRARGMSVQTHLSESKCQAIQAQHRWGHTATAELARVGVLHERFVGAHGVWLAPDDLPLLRDAGATVCYNPASNLRLGSGLAPVRDMLDGGVRVALGTDGSVSSDNQNMFTALQLAGMLGGVRRPYSPAEWVTADDVLGMAVTAGSHAMGKPGQVGAVQPGYLADLSILRSDVAPLSPAVDVLNAVVYAGTGTSAETVLVDGRVVLRDGRSALVDEDDLCRRAQHAAQRLVERNRETMRKYDGIAPYLAAAYDDYPAFDLGFSRYAN